MEKRPEQGVQATIIGWAVKAVYRIVQQLDYMIGGSPIGSIPYSLPSYRKLDQSIISSPLMISYIIILGLKCIIADCGPPVVNSKKNAAQMKGLCYCTNHYTSILAGLWRVLSNMVTIHLRAKGHMLTTHCCSNKDILSYQGSVIMSSIHVRYLQSLLHVVLFMWQVTSVSWQFIEHIHILHAAVCLLEYWVWCVTAHHLWSKAMFCQFQL